MKVTRRALAQIVLAQAAAPQVPPTAAPSGDDLLTAAREQTRKNTEALAKVALPMSTEPAFTFKA